MVFGLAFLPPLDQLILCLSKNFANQCTSSPIEEIFQPRVSDSLIDQLVENGHLSEVLLA